MKQKVLIIAPAWNEEDKIEKALSNLPKALVDKIVVVDDGSTDSTAQIAKECGAHVISHTANMGVGASIRTGIDFAIRNKYDIAVIISGSGKTKGEEVASVLEPVLNDETDLVQGSRYIDGGIWDNMPWHRRLGTFVYSKLFSIAVRASIKDASSGFRAFKLSILDDKRINLRQDWLNRYELEPYLLYKVIKLGYKVKEIPVTIEYPACPNYTKMKPITDWWKIFRPIIFLALKIKR